MEIGKIFTSVFGSEAYNRKIFLIFAEWTNFPQHYDITLNWAYIAYGIPPHNYLYALAQTHYFSDSAAKANVNIEHTLAAIKNSSDTAYIKTLEIGEIASVWGLKLAAYEAGPGMEVGDTTNIGNRIEAQRDPKIKQIVADDILKNWFGLPRPGDLYNYIFCSG